MKKIFKVIILILIIYLFISSVYICIHIGSSSENIMYAQGYDEFDNVIRVFMGIPKTYTTNTDVSPIYLIEVIFKIVLTIPLIIYLVRNRNKSNIRKIKENTYEKY